MLLNSATSGNTASAPKIAPQQRTAHLASDGQTACDSFAERDEDRDTRAGAADDSTDRSRARRARSSSSRGLRASAEERPGARRERIAAARTAQRSFGEIFKPGGESGLRSSCRCDIPADRSSPTRSRRPAARARSTRASRVRARAADPRAPTSTRASVSWWRTRQTRNPSACSASSPRSICRSFSGVTS